MNLTAKREINGGLALYLDSEAKDSLKIILNRALNTWPEAPAEWKELADMLEHGKVLQDYRLQK